MAKKGSKKPKHGQGLMDTGIPKQPTKKEMIDSIMTKLSKGLDVPEKVISLPTTNFTEVNIFNKPLQDLADFQSALAKQISTVTDQMNAATKQMEAAMAVAAKQIEAGMTAAVKPAEIATIVSDGTNGYSKGTLGYWVIPDKPLPAGWMVVGTPAAPDVAQDFNFNEVNYGYVSGRDTMKIINDAIPGFKDMYVKYPGERWHGRMELELAIIRLNDNEGWSREQIADWLETLDYDLTIRMPEKREEVTA